VKLVKESLNEKFKKESDPIKDLDIGFKFYRCGGCGTPTDKDGNTLNKEDFDLAVEAIKKGTDPESLTMCDACENAILSQQQMEYEYERARREEEQRWHEENEARREEEQRWHEENE